jgi:hypothetical protein
VPSSEVIGPQKEEHMNKQKNRSSKEKSNVQSAKKLPPWHCPGWRGPKVEPRPEEASEGWPEKAVERAIFCSENFPKATARVRSRLPKVVYFGADGWPIYTPERVKSALDPRMKVELHRFPWSADLWTERDWRVNASDYDRFNRWVKQSQIISGLLSSRLLPSPTPLD